MPDVHIFQTPDGGDVELSGGNLVLGRDLQAAAYLSLYGGNEDDLGRLDDENEWWGNLVAKEDSEKLRSAFQSLLSHGVPATSGNLKRIEDAASSDLEWMVIAGLADEVAPSVSIVAPNRIAVSIAMTLGDERYTLPDLVTDWSV